MDCSCRGGTEGTIGTTVSPGCDVFGLISRDVGEAMSLGYRMPKVVDQMLVTRSENVTLGTPLQYILYCWLAVSGRWKKRAEEGG